MTHNKTDKAARKLEKKLQQAEKLRKAAENAKPDGKNPKIAFEPKLDKSPKNIECRLQFLKKEAIFNSCPSIYDHPMTWCAQIADVEGTWQWGEHRRWTDNEWTDGICKKLNGIEGEKWSHIRSLLTGEAKNRKKRRKLHHDQEISTLHKDAQKRWISLELEQFDTAFRFRFGGNVRAWGFLYGPHFYLIWWERKHKICPQK